MSVFTKIDIDYVNRITKKYELSFFQLKEISDGLDNSVYQLSNKFWEKFILKIYESKNNFFINNLLQIHNKLETSSINWIILFVKDFIEWKDAILFDYISKNTIYDIEKIIEKISNFHKNLNNISLKCKTDKFIKDLNEETSIFYNEIEGKWYIEQYKDYINTDELYSLFYYHINKILNKKIYLHVWYIHNDLCKWNIIPNDINWIEFIDYDGINFNFLIKDYIIFIIRFNLFNDIKKLFLHKNNKIIIWEDKIDIDIFNSLYIIYSINLIFNMIYYIWYNEKEVWEKNFINNQNQSWQEIYKNLQNII